MIQLRSLILFLLCLSIFTLDAFASYVEGDYRGPEIVRVLYKDISQEKPITTYLRVYHVGLIKIESCEGSVCSSRVEEISQVRSNFIQELALRAASDGPSQLKRDIQCEDEPVSTDLFLKSNTYSMRGKLLAVTSDTCHFQLYKNKAGLDLIRIMEPILEEFLSK